MRKFLALLLVIGLVAFSAVAGASDLGASKDVNATLTYRHPLSLEVATPAGTLYIQRNTDEGTAVPIWSEAYGSEWATDYVSCDRDITNNGLTVFHISGSPNQSVTISSGNTDRTVTLTGPGCGNIDLQFLRICLTTSNGLHSTTKNCCGSGNIENLPITINLGSSGEGYFAIRPWQIRVDDMSCKGWYTGTMIIIADYQ